MTRLALSLATRLNERVRPLVDGTVRPAWIDLIPTVSHPGETFWRQLRFGAFNVSEMSLSSFLIARSQGSDLVAIPAFPSRRFVHIELDARIDASIDRPSDLAGKRIPVPDISRRPRSGRARCPWRRWRANGVWAEAITHLAAIVRVLHEREPAPSMVIIDAQTVNGARYGPTFHHRRPGRADLTHPISSAHHKM